MSRTARVRSIDALRRLSEALAVFEAEAGMALSQAEADARSAAEWLSREQIPHWTKTVRLRQERAKQAQSDYVRTKAFVTEVKPVSFDDKRRAAEQAKESLDASRESLDATKRYSREIDKKLELYRGRTQRLAVFLTAQLPMARASLERMAEHLEQYASGAPPAPKPESRTTAANTGDRERADTWALRMPTRHDRQTAPLAGPPDPFPELLTELACERLMELGLASEPSPELDRVIIDAAAFSAENVLLRRSARPGLGDTGWFIGDAARAEPSERTMACRLGALIELAPMLALPLTLAAGVTIVTSDGALVEVLDPAGARVYPEPGTMAGNTGEPASA